MISALFLLHLILDSQSMGRITPHFEPNQGQVAGETEWTATAPGGTLYITGPAVAFATAEPGAKPRIMRFVGARKGVKGEGDGPTGGYSSYFAGRDEKNWRSRIPHYAKVRYRDVYPGIDLVYYATPARQVEYDLELAPGADPSQLDLAFEGFDRIEVDPNGDLLLWANDRAIRQKRPSARAKDGASIDCSYRLLSAKQVRLDVARFDERMPITIDPELDFSTFIGGPGYDVVQSIAFDAAGFIYLTGLTDTPLTPTLNPFQQPNTVKRQAFVLKLTSNAEQIVTFTALSGSGYTAGASISIDKAGAILLYGTTSSQDFPLVKPFQREYRAGYYQAFVAKLAPDFRTLLYSSYFGGSVAETVFRAVLTSDGSMVITGNTQSKDIPIRNALQPSAGLANSQCFLAKVDPQGALVFSTYFGGSGTTYCYGGLAVDQADRIYFGGVSSSEDLLVKNAIQTSPSPLGWASPFIARVSSDGQTLDFSTYLVGGLGVGGVSAIAVNEDGEAHVGMGAQNSRFPAPDGFQDTCESRNCGYIVKLDTAGQKVLNATYLGGTGYNSLQDLLLGPDGSVYVGGTTGSADFPVKDSLQPFRGGGPNGWDVYVARLTPDLRTLIYSTFFGGSRGSLFGKLALDPAGRLYFGGSTLASDFPVRNAVQPVHGGFNDGVLLRLSNTVGGAAAPSPISASPGRVSLRWVQGGPPLAPQQVRLNADSGVAFTSEADSAWVTLNPRTGTAPATMQVSASILGPGNYTANVTVKPASGAALTIPVNLTILTPAPELTSVEPSFVAFASDDTIVTLRGAGFTAETKVRLYDGPYSSPVTFVDSQTLQFKMSYLSFLEEGSYRFSVVNPQSDVSKAVVLSVGRVTPSITSVVSAASRLSGPAARGGLLAISGLNLGPLDRLKATIGDIPAPAIAVTGKDQVAVVVPALVKGTSAAVVVSSDALVSAPFRIEIADAAPGLFTADESGTGDALIDGTPSPGSTITLFGTGDGGLPVTVTIDGKEALVDSAAAPVDGKPGWFQVRVVVPADASVEGPVAVLLKAGDHESQPGVTLTLR
jgi:uncharacterized protein (TIGR03437 family)